MAKNRRRLFIREWRKYRKLNQTQLADRVGITQAQVSKLENGVAEYTQSHLEALSEALGCEPVDLIMRDPSDPENMWSIWDKASAGQKQQIRAVATALLTKVAS